MPDLDLPIPGVTPGPEWATKNNAALNALNDVMETGRLSQESLEAELVATAAELNPEALSDEFIALQVSTPGSETQSSLSSSFASKSIQDIVTTGRLSESELSLSMAEAAGEIPEVALAPFKEAGHSYVASGSNQRAGTTFMNRLAGRLNMGAQTNYGVGGYRTVQMANKLRAEWVPSSRCVFGTMCTLNDVGAYGAEPALTTTAEAMRTTLAIATSLAILNAQNAAFDPSFGTWTSGSVANSRTSSTVGDDLRFVFSGDAVYLQVLFTASTAGTVEIRSDNGSNLYASRPLSGYREDFPGVIRVSGLGAGDHILRARVASGTVTVLGLIIPSPTPPLIVWWKENPIPAHTAHQTMMLHQYHEVQQAVVEEFNGVVVDYSDDWDPDRMLIGPLPNGGADYVHPNGVGNEFYARQGIKALAQASREGTLPTYLSDLEPAAYTNPTLTPWPQITAAVSDTFSGTPGASLTARTGEVGATWTAASGFTGSMVISDQNRARKGDSNSVGLMASGTPQSADYAVEADFTVLSAVGGVGTSIALRMVQSGGNLNCYEMRFVPGSTQWRITRRSGTTATDIATTANGAVAVGDTVKARLVATGSTLRAYVNQVLIMEITDSTYSAAGQAGIVSTGAAATDTTSVHLDNFKAGVLAP